ncbi:MAG: anhydro-N-acetylmuramic acid kinase [Gammaproteobacteria bacterium]|nr:anhydro-N-acetylmuramic acid kinase [Gammaproteobacteria bacterium]
MSGTSMDAVDAALVRFHGKSVNVVAYHQYPFPPDVHDALKTVSPESPISRVARLDSRLGSIFADAALRLIASCNRQASQVTAIGSHGQTVFHSPDTDGAVTVQIGDPSRIALLTGITTVADLRRMDAAAGGQGAPIAPAFHAWVFRDSDRNRAVINLGGIANVSILPADQRDIPVTGFDTGPGNTLLDQWAQRCLGRAMDRGGEWAQQGFVSTPLLERMLKDPYFAAAAPKSTGREYFNLNWLEGYLARISCKLELADVQATLAELTCRTITQAIQECAPQTDQVLVCGGGVNNSVLIKRIQACLAPVTVQSTSCYGIHPDSVEAVMCAWLAMRRMKREPANLPSVTGATRPVLLGAIYEPGLKSRTTSRE